MKICSLLAVSGCFGCQNAAMLSWTSSLVGISNNFTAPSPQSPDRLEPEAWAPFEAGFEILIGGEIPLPLHQAEAPRFEVGETAHLQIVRIVERTPELLASPVEDRKSVGIVNRRAEVVEILAVVWPEDEHAGHRREPGMLHVARVERHLHVENSGLPRSDREAVARRGALAVQQRMHHDRGGIRRRLFQPERLEERELFAFAFAGVDRQSARGQTVGLPLRDRPEVACAEEYADFVVVVRSVDRSVDAESSKANVTIRPLSETFAEREVLPAVGHRHDASVHHLEDVHPVLVEEAAVEKLHLERQLLVAPQRLLRRKANGPVLVVVEICQRIRQLLVGGLEWLRRKSPGKLADKEGLKGGVVPASASAARGRIAAAETAADARRSCRRFTLASPVGKGGETVHVPRSSIVPVVGTKVVGAWQGANE